MKSKSIIVFLLLLLLSIVRAQNVTPTITEGAPTTTIATTAPTETKPGIETCLELRRCGSDINCRAECAGVPNPSDKQINDTIACIEKCNPTDPTNSTCRDACINTYYYNSKTTTFFSPTPTPAPSVSASAAAATNSSVPNETSQSKPTPISGNAVKLASPFNNLFTLLFTLIVIFVSIDYF